ncbi:arylesterase [Methylocella sp.]|uniref:arylesterase n=1 Tax=Methylocella sp. TaxID=1978226 RepID=UPI0037850DC8
MRRLLTKRPGARRADEDLYGGRRRFLKGALLAGAAAALCGAASPRLCAKETAAKPAQGDIVILALGDSLTAGYGLPAAAAFPAALERRLRADGVAARVVNAGVSGDTTSGGLARLDWAMGDGVDAAIVELGANDMLRGVDPKIARAALRGILEKLRARGVPVLIAGMRASGNLDAAYRAEFDAIYPDLAREFDAALYPFFLDAAFGRPALLLPDGLHPNAAGVEAIVAAILPQAKALAAKARAASSPENSAAPGAGDAAKGALDTKG